MNFDLARQPILVNMLCVVLFVITAMSIVAAEPLGSISDQILAHSGSPVEQLLMQSATIWPLAAKVLTIALLLINSFYITRLTISNVVYLSHSFMPAMFLMCLGFSAFCSVYSFIPLFSVLLILRSVGSMTSSYSIKGLATGRWFIVGVYAGLAGVIYMPSTLFAVMIPIGLLLFRPIDIREWVAVVGGYGLMLFYCAFADHFALGGRFVDTFVEIGAFWSNISAFDGVRALVGSYRLPDWMLLGSAIVAGIISIIRFITSGSLYKPLELRTFEFLALMLLLTALFVGLSGVSMLSFLPLLAMSLALVLPAYFVNHGGNFISNFLFVLIVGSALITILIDQKMS